MTAPREQYYSERPAYDDRRAVAAKTAVHMAAFLEGGGEIIKLPTSPGFVDMSPIPKKSPRRRADGTKAPTQWN